MNRKNLTAAVLAGLAGVAGIAGTAQAVNMNPDGLGQVLIYPYYTANDGNQTILSVVNTTDNAKAVKVRFLEGFNSREVLDFNLYMSEWDVWVAAIAADDVCTTGGCGAKLVIPDSSCTVPYLYNHPMYPNGVPFLDLAYTGDFADGGPTSIARTAEGHFEMIEMGTLTGVAADNVRHGDDDMPADCEALTEWWTDYVGEGGQDGIWFQEATLDDDGDPKLDECVPYPQDYPNIDDPIYSGCQAESYTIRASGGMFGAASVVNSQNGTMFSYDALALQGFDKTGDGIHYIPGTIFPSLNSGNISESWVFFGVPQNQAVFLDYEETVDAVSSVFMHAQVMNEYVVDDALNAGTEWIVTFPTKNFYADEDRMVAVGLIDDPADNMPGNGVTCDTDDDGDYVDCVAHARAPFTQLFGATGTGDAPVCEVVSLQTWDREENTFVPELPGGPRPPVVSPSLPGLCNPDIQQCEFTTFQLCYEVNVLRFGEESVFGTPEVDGMTLLLSVEDEFSEGWGRLDLVAKGRVLISDGTDDMGVPTPGAGVGLLGLPVAGFAAMEFENGYLDGGSVKANYGGLFRHKGNVQAIDVPLIQPVTSAP